MEIEIDGELEDRIEEVHNDGVIKGVYPMEITPKEMIEKLVRTGLVKEEKILGLTPKEHNCTEHIAYSGEYKYIGDTVLFYGKCSVCGKELVHGIGGTKEENMSDGEKNAKEIEERFIHAGKMEFEGKTLSDVETSIDESKKKILQTIKIKSSGITSGFDKIGDGNYRFEIGDKELFTKKEERKIGGFFIHADQWRELTASNIISSMDIGLTVLKEKEGFSKEYHGQLLVLIEEIAKMLARDV